jgi:signal transduction histidine kinase
MSRTWWTSPGEGSGRPALPSAGTALVALLCLGPVLVWALTGGGYFWPRWTLYALGLLAGLWNGLRWAWRTPPGARRWLTVHLVVFAVLTASEVTIWVFSGLGYFWPVWSLLGRSLLLGVHAWLVERMSARASGRLTQRIDVLSRTRSGALDSQAAELRRIERDLHDGAQARMVSLGMSLGMAEELIRTDAEGATRLVAEARATTLSALEDLRTVMQGIHPSVLADRGLPGAVQALALDLALPVTTVCDLPGRAPAAIESAMYFGIAECLANVVKHSRARSAAVELGYRDGRLTAVVTDDGQGGARLDGTGGGTGLRGVLRRLEAFDGAVTVHSPTGGPTVITLEVPCALSSPRISPSSGTD